MEGEEEEEEEEEEEDVEEDIMEAHMLSLTNANTTIGVITGVH